MPSWNLQGASVKINNVVVGHGLVTLDINDKIILRETLNASNTPYAKKEKVGNQAEGTAEFTADSANAFPTLQASTPLVVQNATGVYFSGNVTIQEIGIKSGVEAEKGSALSLKFATVDGGYTFAKSAS